MTGGSTEQRGFQHSVFLHLEAVAELLLVHDGDCTQKAYWDLQMSCESAYKALLVQQTGTFPMSHDLFHLHDACAEGSLSFSRDLLKRVPRWQEMANLRYAQGTRQILNECFDCYVTVLDIVAGVLEATKGMRLGNARFELKTQLPWMRRP